jgi:hypothetical protein
MISVVYPYLGGKAIWREMIYSLRSLEKHFKEEFQVVIVGDMPDGIDKNKVIYIPHEKNYDLEHPRYMDAQLKLIAALESPLVSDEFLCMYDDIYFNKDFDADFFRNTLLGQRNRTYNSLDEISGSGSREWKMLLLKTMNKLRSQNLTATDFESHLPRWVRKDVMKDVVDVFKLKDEAHQRWTLYYNCLLFNQKMEVLYYREHEIIKAGYYLGESPTQDISKYWFINHNDAGLSEKLKKALKKLFPNKSRFEL